MNNACQKDVYDWDDDNDGLTAYKESPYISNIPIPDPI